MPRKPTPKRQTRTNLQRMVRKKALDAGLRPDADLAAMAIAMLVDLPDDVDHHATRARLKLDILRFMHEMNVNQLKYQASGDGSDLDQQLLELLASRKARKEQA